MSKKNLLTALATAFLSLAAFTPLDAEVFTQTYTTTECKDYEFITEMLIGPGVARHPSGALIDQSKSYQVGVFSNLVAKSIPTFTNGVILSTGKIGQGPSTQNEKVNKQWSGESIWPNGVPEEYGVNGDIDLYNYFGKKLNDQAGIVLYVQPRNRTINIPFFMASEYFYYQTDLPVMADTPSYESYTNRSDKFVFFLKEIADASDPGAFDSYGNVIDDGSPMTPYRNIAQLPTGGDVEISTVNQHTNTQYFLSNVGPTNEYGELEFPFADLNLPMEFNGAIVGPVAVAEGLDTNKVYKLKIIVADDFNNIVNSAIFLRARGITSGADLAVDVTGPAKLDVAGTVTFTNTVSNIEAATADGVKVTQWLPTGIDETKLDTIKASVKCSTGSVTSWGKQGETNYFVWTIGERFASGSNAVLTVDCPLPGVGEYRTVARVETSTGDFNEANDTDDCVTTVGTLKPELHIKAISTNKVYGTTLTLTDLQYVGVLTGTNGTETVTGITVTFTNAAGQVSDPCAATAPVGTYRICLADIEGLNLDDFRKVVYEEGSLEVTKIKDPIIIMAASATKKYDGTALITNDYTYTDGILVGDDKLSATVEGTITDVGAVSNKVTSYQIKNGDADVTSRYTFGTSVDGELKVTKRAVTLTSGDATKAFDNTPLTNTTDPVVSGDGWATGEGATYTVTGTQTTVGTSKNTFTYALNGNTKEGNYDITKVEGDLTVTPDATPIVITAASAEKVYDGTPLTANGFTYTAGVLAEGDVLLATVSGTITEAGEAPNKVTAYQVMRGSVDVTGEYAFGTPVDGKLKVEKRPLEISARNLKKNYGQIVAFTGSEFLISDGELVEGDAVTSVTLECAGAVATADYQANGYEIIPSNAQGTGLKNYDITYVPAKLIVKRVALTILADDTNRVYGTVINFTGSEFKTVPELLPNDDRVTSVTISSERAGDSKAEAKVYEWDVVPGHEVLGINTNNYDIVFSNGTLTVTKADLTIVANSTNRAYGTTLAFAGNEFTTVPEELPNGEQVVSVKITSDGNKAGDPKTAADIYAMNIIPSHVVTGASGFSTNNYEIVFSNGTLTVTKADLTIIADSTNRVYGTTLAFAGDEFTTVPEELPNGEQVVSVTLASDGNKAGDPKTAAGTYAMNIIPAQVVAGASGFSTNNYAIVFSNGTLTVSRAALTIIANDTNRVYGATLAIPPTAFTTEPRDLPNGEKVTEVTIASDGNKAGDPTSDAGTYVTNIIPSHVVTGVSGFSTNNYAIAFSNGTFTVTKAPIAICAKDTNKVYGVALAIPNTEFSVVPAVLPNGERVETVTISCGEALDVNADVGTYEKKIEPGHVVTGSANFKTNNYEIAFSNATLAVTPAPLTIRVNDAVWKIKKPKPQYSFTDFSAQLFGTDTIAGITGGAGLATDLAYSNKVWEASQPEKGQEGLYEDEIWIKTNSIAGVRAKNYVIAIDPGDLTVVHAEPELHTSIAVKEDADHGLENMILTVRNDGDGEVDPDYGYWVELLPGPSTNGVLRPEVFYEKMFYLTNALNPSLVKVMPDGTYYQDLTVQVTNALKQVGNRDTVFDPGEEITVEGVSYYHWQRWKPECFISDFNQFFVWGYLFNQADTDRDFRISAGEKAAAEPILGSSSADYLEVTRLELLQYYHWKMSEETWVGPAK